MTIRELIVGCTRTETWPAIFIRIGRDNNRIADEFQRGKYVNATRPGQTVFDHRILISCICVHACATLSAEFKPDYVRRVEFKTHVFDTKRNAVTKTKKHARVSLIEFLRGTSRAMIRKLMKNSRRVFEHESSLSRSLFFLCLGQRGISCRPLQCICKAF